jgi:hypothetical protein
VISTTPSPQAGADGACRVLWGQGRAYPSTFTGDLDVPPPPTPDAPPGQVVFDQPGSYRWTPPQGVTAVSVVCVGGGGEGIHCSRCMCASPWVGAAAASKPANTNAAGGQCNVHYHLQMVAVLGRATHCCGVRAGGTSTYLPSVTSSGAAGGGGECHALRPWQAASL